MFGNLLDNLTVTLQTDDSLWYLNIFERLMLNIFKGEV